MSCKHVLLNESDYVEHDREDYFVDLTCTNPAKFDPQLDDDLFHAHDVLEELARRGEGVGVRKLAAQTLGLNYNPHGLLRDADLRRIVPPSTNFRDPMHTLLARGGVMLVELFALLNAIKAAVDHFSYEMLWAYVQSGWELPFGKQKSSSVATCLSPARERAANKNECFRASASEALGVYPIVRYFVEAVVTIDAIHPQRRSFLALCEIVDSASNVKYHYGDAGADDLVPTMVQRYLELHVGAYGRQYLKQKHRYSFHMRLYLDCFVQERKHIVAKAMSERVSNTTVHEQSCSTFMLNACYRQMDSLKLDTLMGQTTSNDMLSVVFGSPVTVARRMRSNGLRIQTGDVISTTGVFFFRVHACVAVDSGCKAIVHRLDVVAQPSHTITRLRLVDDTMYKLDTTDARVAQAWHKSGNDIVVAGPRCKKSVQRFIR